jgi:hypothetical protein
LQRTAWIASHINRLISGFRRDDYADALGFVTQVGVMLSDYPDEVIEYVCSPKTGLLRTSKFAPVPAEIVAACDERMRALHRQKELEAWRERKKASDALKASGAKYSSFETRPGEITYEQFVKRCEENRIEARPIGRFESRKSGTA